MFRAIRIAFGCLAVLISTTAFAAATAPALSSISPQTVIAGTGGFTLTVNGAGFLSGATVLVNGTTRTTTFVSASKVTAAITSSDVLNVGSLQITATNPGSVASNALSLSVLPNSPTITSINPSSLLTGTTNLTVTITGQNFASTAQAQVNTSPRATTYVNDKQLTFTLTSNDVASPITLQISVANPNNKTSNSVSLTVKVGTAQPTITLLNPSSVVAGSAAFTLSVVGTNFVSGTVVKVNGVTRPTTFVDTSHLTTQITSSDIALAGTLNITVLNPDGTASTASPLTVTSTLTPTIVSISPSSVAAGSAAFTLTINGTNFVSGATVQIGSVTRNATYVNSTTVTVPVVASDVVAQGQISIKVTTPAPNGGTSNSMPLYVVSNQAPVVTSITPSSVVAASAPFSLVVNGSGFLLDDIVQLDGSARTTQYFSATQLAASITATDLAVAGTHNITVAHKNGSGTSAPVVLTIAPANAPAILGFNPAAATVGQAPFTLAVIGQNFDTTSVVTLDNTPRSTKYVSSTELDVQVTASDVASARDLPVTVINSDGVTTATMLFSVTVPQLAITALTPSSVISGDNDFTLTVAGSGFTSKSVINIGGSARTTQVQSDGTLTTSMAASDIAAPGTLAVTVTDSGGVSAPATLTVLRPTIVSVDPAQIVLGTPSATLTISGSAFLSTSKIIFLGSEQTTTVNPDGTLSATLSGLDSLSQGQYAVTVKNSSQSVSAPYLITLALPGTATITSLSPSSLPAGSPATAVIISGTNFVSSSIARVNGATRATTFNNANSLTVSLTAADLATAGTLNITVVNPDGSVSAPAQFTVQSATYTPPRRRSSPHP